MGVDQVASLLPAGAGRFQDFVWPDEVVGANGVGASMRARNGGGIVTGTNVAIGGGIGALTAVINGVPCQQLLSNVGVGNQRLMYPGFPVMLRVQRSKIGPYCDDCSVYRIIFTAATGAVAPAANRDWGFELSIYQGAPGFTSRIVVDAAPGIGLRFNSANVVQLLVRGPNGLVITDLTAAPFTTVNTFHTFDMRFFSATEFVDAFWTLRIDGGVVALSDVNSNWGAVGTNLPPMSGVGGGAGTSTVGFIPSIVSDANNNNGLFVKQLRCIAAPSELMTL